MEADENNGVHKASHDFHYRGWRIRLGLDRTTPEGFVACHADLFEGDAMRLHVMHCGPQMRGGDAMQALAARARVLIDEQLAVALDGNT